MRYFFTFLIFTFMFSFTLFGCQCVRFKSFLQNIKNADLVIFGEVVTFKYEDDGFSKKLMGIKVADSFGAGLDSDTIWIRQGGGIDCVLVIDFFNESDKIYFALNYDSNNYNRYEISECGENFLRTEKDKKIAYGIVNFHHNRISQIFKFHTGKISKKK